MAGPHIGTPGRVGELLGKWRVVRELGRGGMGQVFEVVHTDLDRRAAAKVLHQEYSRDEKIAQRFINEARAVNRVQHSGLVNVFDGGHLPDGATYIVMEYLEGETLAARLHRSRVRADPRLLRLLLRVGSALSAVHDKGIIHRDLKPENVMIIPHPDRPGDERIKVLDFGLAKLLEEHHASAMGHFRTSAGTVLGTPVYMSPEQCREARGVSDRADVYSLGVILYQVLAGRPPFLDKSAWRILQLHMNARPAPVSEVAPGTPRALAALVHRMLAKAPQQRPSMKEVVKELHRVLQKGPGLFEKAPALSPDGAAPGPLTDSHLLRAAAGTLVSRRGRRHALCLLGLLVVCGALVLLVMARHGPAQ